MGNYKLFEREKNGKKIAHSISASFVLLSGNCITFPTQEYHAANLPFSVKTNTYFFRDKLVFVNN
jgi:hypothetical protein